MEKCNQLVKKMILLYDLCLFKHWTFLCSLTVILDYLDMYIFLK